MIKGLKDISPQICENIALINDVPCSLWYTLVTSVTDVIWEVYGVRFLVMLFKRTMTSYSSNFPTPH